MARTESSYECNSCGAAHRKWAGQCSSCGEWNALEEVLRPSPSAGGGSARHAASQLRPVSLAGNSPPKQRIQTGIGELDRVLGGGAVAGSSLLLAGEPGIGKSTLLIQTAAMLANAGQKVLYVSGEESIDQIRERARRLGISQAPVMLENSGDADAIAAALVSPGGPGVAIVDSIQTLRTSTSNSVPGSIAQVRMCAQMLCDAAMQSGCVLILVGHVTKESSIGGPKTLEHLVDGVFLIEAERGNPFRILRANKNRFGATDEIGVFEMRDEGLTEVPNPSQAFLSERRPGVPGSAVFTGIEGSRPVLLEIQALLAPTSYATPKRTIVGYDANRVSMLLAVLQSVCGVDLSASDLFINVAGGLKIQEPAADLAILAAVLSAAIKAPCPKDAVFFGEVGLIGEVRRVGRSEARSREAAKLGFRQVFCPPGRIDGGIGQNTLTDVDGLVSHLYAVGTTGPTAATSSDPKI